MTVNLCNNPASKNNVTGYGGGSTPTRVTNLSTSTMLRATGARWTTGTYQQTPTVAATAGTAYTGSMYVLTESYNQSGKTFYVVFTRSTGGDDFTHTQTVALTFGTAQRLSMTVTAPANTTGMYLLLDGVNSSVSAMNITSVMYDNAGLNSYNDGDSSGWAWDGTAGNSSSKPAAVSGPSVSVWNGTAEVPATVSVWNGTAEVSATVSIAP